MVFLERKDMFSKRFLLSLMSGIFATNLLLNLTVQCTANTAALPTKDSSGPASFQPKSMEEAIATIESAIEKADLEKKVLTGLQKKINSKPANSFDELELQSFVNLVLNTYGPDLSRDSRTALRTVLSFLSKRLRSYNVSGVAFACDPNAALIGDTQNPSFTALFKDQNGNVKTRIFDALITSYGLKIAFSINLNFIFFTGDINFEDSSKVLELGTGIDISGSILRPISPYLPGLLFLYAPFINAPGGIVMAGIPLGICGGLSIVTSGTLTPRIN